MLYFVSQVNTCFQQKMGLLKRNSGLNLIIIDLTINKNIALLHMGLVLVSSNPLLNAIPFTLSLLVSSYWLFRLYPLFSC